ncbi:4Fe-4S binding protein [Raoultibacter phocaeensis]|uniref:4Fe-4S binding protein n=1 Tax=Raoultibacter phocaeensis TaxID=2479841 RepID=UPI00111AF970|nr:4Fe-4S binding protein [Raoultibacter phocaeensis]
MRKYLAIDYDYCTGCHTCEIACQQEHGLDPDHFGIKLTQIGPDKITDRRWQYEFVPVPTERCDHCALRQMDGKLPSCVQHCQAGCIYYGTLEELGDKIDKLKVAIFS